MAEAVQVVKADPSVKIPFYCPGKVLFSIRSARFQVKIGALMVVMGTHGIKGMQKLMGSWALKVITSSKVPFIAVQDTPKADVF